MASRTRERCRNKASLSNERLETLIRAAVDTHQNMLRVWGGGFYETVTCSLPAGWTASQAEAALRIRSVYDSFAVT